VAAATVERTTLTEPEAGPRRRLLTILAGAAAATVLLLPPWAFGSFPSQDGPAHVYNARLLLLLLQGRLPEAQPFYTLHLSPFPNWTSHAVLAALCTFLSPGLAERLLLTAYALALPLAFRYALGGIRRDASPLAWLVLPFVYNKWLHEGFYNRSLALVPLLLALGYYLRRRGRLSLRESCVLGAAALGSYFTSATSLVALALTLGPLAVAFAREDDPAILARPWRARLPGLLALVPACALLVAFDLGQQPQTTGPGPALTERALYLGGLYDVVAYDRSEAWIAAALAALLGASLAAAVVARVRARRRSWTDALLASAALLAVLYLVVPQVTIPGVRSEPQHVRLSLHVLLATLLWITASVPRRLARPLAAGALAIALALTLVRLPTYRALASLVDEQLSLASFIPRGAVFLPVSFDYEGLGVVHRPIPEEWIVGPLWHAGARVAAARDLVLVDNYEAATLHFPLRYRAGANPQQLLTDPLDDSAGCLRLGRFNRLAPRPLEYLLLYRRELAKDDGCTHRTLAYVDQHYERTARSAGHGFAELYRLRRGQPAD
jgi:hypothetical protein